MFVEVYALVLFVYSFNAESAAQIKVENTGLQYEQMDMCRKVRDNILNNGFPGAMSKIGIGKSFDIQCIQTEIWVSNNN